MAGFEVTANGSFWGDPRGCFWGNRFLASSQSLRNLAGLSEVSHGVSVAFGRHPAWRHFGCSSTHGSLSKMLSLIKAASWSKLFQWQLAAVLPTWLGMIWATLQFDSFTAARIFSVITAVWACGAWFTSSYFVVLDREDRLDYWRQLAPVALVAMFITGMFGYIHSRELQSLKGVLYPANDKTPLNPCHKMRPSESETYAVLILGSNAVPIKSFPHTVLEAFSRTRGRERVISIDRDESGRLYLMLDVKSADGKLVVRMNREGFAIGRNAIFEMQRPDRSTVSVIDAFGKHVLYCRYHNTGAISITGEVSIPGSGTYPLRDSHLQNNCVEGGMADLRLEIP